MSNPYFLKHYQLQPSSLYCVIKIVKLVYNWTFLWCVYFLIWARARFKLTILHQPTSRTTTSLMHSTLKLAGYEINDYTFFANYLTKFWLFPNLFSFFTTNLYFCHSLLVPLILVLLSNPLVFLLVSTSFA